MSLEVPARSTPSTWIGKRFSQVCGFHSHLLAGLTGALSFRRKGFRDGLFGDGVSVMTVTSFVR